MKYLYDPPKLLKKVFSSFVWNSTCEKILISFDDGPSPETTEVILTQLSKHKLKVIFFCVGNNVKRYPELAKKIIEDGHLIGNHTFNHKILTKINYPEALKELSSTNEIIADIAGEAPEYFRPPHGRFKPNSQKLFIECGLKNVMWSCLTFDYKNDLNIVKFAVQNYLKKNSIVVLHDRIKNKEIITDSISFLLEEAERKGFEIGKPEECLN